MVKAVDVCAIAATNDLIALEFLVPAQRLRDISCKSNVFSSLPNNFWKRLKFLRQKGLTAFVSSCQIRR